MAAGTWRTRSLCTRCAARLRPTANARPTTARRGPGPGPSGSAGNDGPPPPALPRWGRPGGAAQVGPPRWGRPGAAVQAGQLRWCRSGGVAQVGPLRPRSLPWVCYAWTGGRPTSRSGPGAVSGPVRARPSAATPRPWRQAPRRGAAPPRGCGSEARAPEARELMTLPVSETHEL